MTRRDKSREEWEQEIVRRQQNITPADFPEGVHYARIDGLPKVVSQVRFWLGIVLIAVGVSMARFVASVGAAVGILVIAGGVLIAVRAMDWKETRKQARTRK